MSLDDEDYPSLSPNQSTDSGSSDTDRPRSDRPRRGAECSSESEGDSEHISHQVGRTMSRGRGRQGREHRGRGRGRGTGRGRGRGRLTERERKVLKGQLHKKENEYTSFPFAGPTPGPTSPSGGLSASACFSRFIIDDVWDLLVEETNRYAASCRQSGTHRRPRPWHDVTREEMKAFIGMCIAMGVVRMPRIENYWSTSHPLFTPGLRNVMPLVRF